MHTTTCDKELLSQGDSSKTGDKDYIVLMNCLGKFLEQSTSAENVEFLGSFRVEEGAKSLYGYNSEKKQTRAKTCSV